MSDCFCGPLDDMAQSGSLKYLTASQVQFYKDNGYLLLENWSTPVEVSNMRLAADAIMDRLEQDKSIQITIFDTGKEQVCGRTLNSFLGGFLLS